MTMSERGEKSPLEVMARMVARDGKPFLSEAAFEAGERLARDFYRAGMLPGVSAALTPRLESRGRGGWRGPSDMTDAMLDARKRVSAALGAIGPELADVAIDFCCFMKGLERMERERQWPVRSAKLMVRTALQALARHYAPPPARGGVRHWGEAGYRPEIAALFAED
ncbi:DUF6456 domain-containing protein [Martelella endophytica]|uniref:DUF6456 domain-containing protein n=1 Tax=Martelella endophytica TaxID=1486262 RepID=UPI000696F7FE|nr:DUF6456 domain-containing protein [Martelella endophytica]